MKKNTITVLLCISVLLMACGTTNRSISNNKAIIDSDINKSKEYTYAELQTVCDTYTDKYLEELSKLSQAELYGLSDDEESRNKNYWRVANSIADQVLEECEISQGQRIIVTGYIGKQGESKEDGFFVRQGLNKIFFHLKHKEIDDSYSGLLCRTDDVSFLELEENTSVKIEAIFIKKGFAASDNDLYDCKLIESNK